MALTKRSRNICYKVTNTKRQKTSNEQVRDWVDLPADVMSLIYEKLSTYEILLCAQKVCSSWRKHAKQPHLFRSLVIRHRLRYFDHVAGFTKFFKQAVDRSCGQLERLSCDVLYQEQLTYVAERSNTLRSLRLETWMSMEHELTEAAKGFPLLEELAVSRSVFFDKEIEAVGRSCQNLKYLRLAYNSEFHFDKEAYAIADYMPHLVVLDIKGITLTNNGLQAIVDGCPHLEILDLRDCMIIDLDRDLEMRCLSRIRKVWLVRHPYQTQ